MAKCPLYRNCSFESSLRGSEGYSHRHFICEGKGTIPDKWRECPMYDPAKIPAKTSSSSGNGKGCLILGSILGLVVCIIASIILATNGYTLNSILGVFVAGGIICGGVLLAFNIFNI